MDVFALVDSDPKLLAAYRGVPFSQAEPGPFRLKVNHFGAAIDMIAAMERSGVDPLRAALEIIYSYDEVLNREIDRKIDEALRNVRHPL